MKHIFTYRSWSCGFIIGGVLASITDIKDSLLIFYGLAVIALAILNLKSNA